MGQPGQTHRQFGCADVQFPSFLQGALAADQARHALPVQPGHGETVQRRLVGVGTAEIGHHRFEVSDGS